MSALPPAQGRTRLADWLPSRTALLLVVAAFAIGLLLFLVLWMEQRNDKAFYRAPVARGTDAPRFDPLPAPLPAGVDPASGMGQRGQEDDAPAEEPEETPRLVEEAPSTPPPAAPEPPRAAGPDRAPVLVSSPPPRYPPQAWRRRESGTVMVRVDIGPDGVPTATSLAQGSGSRFLDRAALDAVRRWRFEPALREGRPTVASVVVPIEFNLGR
jgi:protein TonB